MFHVELAPLGGILGPLKSDLGVFWAKIPSYPYNVKFSKSIFSKSANLPILSFWILNLHIIICQFQKRSTVKHFFSLSPCSCHLWPKYRIDIVSYREKKPNIVSNEKKRIAQGCCRLEVGARRASWTSSGNIKLYSMYVSVTFDLVMQSKDHHNIDCFFFTSFFINLGHFSSLYLVT